MGLFTMTSKGLNAEYINCIRMRCSQQISFRELRIQGIVQMGNPIDYSSPFEEFMRGTLGDNRCFGLN